MCFSEGFWCATLPVRNVRKMKQAVDNSQAFETQVAGLSKALVCLPHELIIAKLNACIFDLKL